MCADEAAGIACREFSLEWSRALNNKQQQLQQSRDDLCSILTLHLLLHQARITVENRRTSQENPYHQTVLAKTPQQIQQQLIGWSPQIPVGYDSVFVSESLAAHFPFGLEWAKEFSSWLSQLVWDTDGNEPSERSIGVTWFELGLSFCRIFWLVVTGGTKIGLGGTAFNSPQTCDEAVSYGYSANDVAVAMCQCWTAFHSLCLHAPPIDVTSGPQYSLFLLGHKSQSSGLKPRPWFPIIPFTVKVLGGLQSYQTEIYPTWVSRSIPRSSIDVGEAKKFLKVGQAAAAA